MENSVLVILVLFASTNVICVQNEKIGAYLHKNTKEMHIFKNEEMVSVDVNQYEPIGSGIFINQINQTGWASLEIETSIHVNDSVQAYTAGYIEAVITKDLIKMHWNNVFGDYCKNQKNYCQRLQDFLNTNLNFLKANVIERREREPYWHQIGLILEQVAGLQDGFKNFSSYKGPHMEIDVMGVYLFNIMGDIEDIAIFINKTDKRLLGSGSCSALIKLLPNNSDLYTSQVTWNDYSSMLRILKNYNLKIHLLPDNDTLVPGRRATFSSYPGTLQSGDDFYVLSSGLVTLETTLSNENMDLYKSIKADKIVLEWMRSILANRLAESGALWASLFTLYNSGTYNNQWMVVDYKQFKPYSSLNSKVLTVLEQIPTLIESDDLTNKLKDKSYWASYNSPFFNNIANLSGNLNKTKKYGDLFSYDKCPRALIFKRDHNKVTDISSMIKLMRYNDYTHDSLSRCECIPPFSAENAIAARSDLNPKDGKFPFKFLGNRPHGATDMKLTSYDLQSKMEFIAFGGPTYDNVPAFDWRKSDFRDTVGHEGQPDLWKFLPFTTFWYKKD